MSEYKRIDSCTWELTFLCNAKCPFCYQDNTPTKELSTKESFQVLDKLAENGIIFLLFTGGEPTVKKDFIQIYRYAAKKGFQISILTNGIRLADKDIQDLFTEYPPVGAVISLHALDEAIFEQVSGLPGSFKKVMAGIEFLKKINVKFTFKIVITRINFEHVDKIKDYCHRNSIRYELTPYICNSLSGKRGENVNKIRLEPNEANYFLFQEDYRRAFDEMEREMGSLSQKLKKKRSRFNCTLVYRTIWLDPLGNTFICAMFRDMPRLSILKDPMDKIFEKHLEIARNYQVRPAECLRCNYLQECKHACVCGIRNARTISKEEFENVCIRLKSVIHLKRRLNRDKEQIAINEAV
jgi:radical SAM protein with 4Fe4S-binding SPASM domain